MISKEQINQIISNIELASKNNDTDLFSRTRDVFQVRLDTYVTRTNRFLESAVIGEIGNNTFDHNLDYDMNHQRGAYFSYIEQDWSMYFQSGTAVCSIDKNRGCSIILI